METKIITRQELYQIVWTESVNTLTKKFNVTEYALRKACRQMSIPLPPTGYWSRIHHGSTVNKEALPQDYTGNNEINLAFELDSNPYRARQKEILNDKRLKLEVSHNLTNPDPLIALAKESLNKKDRSSRYYGQVECERGRLSIRVGRDNIGRALRIMDALIKAFQIRGQSVQIQYETTYVVVQGERIGICLKEHLKRELVKSYYERMDYVGNGILYIELSHVYESGHWQDGQQLLEDQLYKIIAKVEIIGENAHQRSIEREKKEAERRELERIRQEYEKRKVQELENFRELLAKSFRRYQTEIIRTYIDIVEQKAVEKNSMTNEIEEWIKWARHKSDWLDPFIEAEDELLKGVDKKSLSFPDSSRSSR